MSEVSSEHMESKLGGANVSQGLLDPFTLVGSDDDRCNLGSSRNGVGDPLLLCKVGRDMGRANYKVVQTKVVNEMVALMTYRPGDGPVEEQNSEFSGLKMGRSSAIVSILKPMLVW